MDLSRITSWLQTLGVRVRSRQLASSGVLHTGQMYSRAIAMEGLQKERHAGERQLREIQLKRPGQCCPGKSSSQQKERSFNRDSSRQQFCRPPEMGNCGVGTLPWYTSRAESVPLPRTASSCIQRWKESERIFSV